MLLTYGVFICSTDWLLPRNQTFKEKHANPETLLKSEYSLICTQAPSKEGWLSSPLSMRTVSHGNGDAGIHGEDPNVKTGVKMWSWPSLPSTGSTNSQTQSIFVLDATNYRRTACKRHSHIEAQDPGPFYTSCRCYVRREPRDGRFTSPGCEASATFAELRTRIRPVPIEVFVK